MADTMSVQTARPKTSERITITDYGVKRANPSPVVVEEVDILLEEYLSPRKLKALTGMDDLTKVKSLQLKVDTTETSLGNFGTFVPNLQELKIKEGIVHSIRDLGSSLFNLQILWMPRCSLQEIDGISAMDNLAELYIAYNDVVELSPLTMLEHLRLLDIEGNNVDDLKQVEYLACCPKLATLTLDGNPVATSEKKLYGTGKYRQTIKKIIPHLQVLDDVELTRETQDSYCKSTNAFEDDWNYINTFILTDNASADSPTARAMAQSAQASCRPTSSESVSNMSVSSVHTPLPRPTTGYRPGSALKPSSAEKHLHMAVERSSNQSYPQTARPPSTASKRPQSEDINMLKETASELTMGGVVCGNPAKSLRSRVRSARGNQGQLSVAQLSNDFAHFTSTARSRDEAAPTAAETARCDDECLDERTLSLFEEARAFTRQHETTRRIIDQDRAPQVLKIDFDQQDQDAPADGSRSASDDESDAGEPHSASAIDHDLSSRSPRKSNSIKDLPVKHLPPPPSPSGALNPLKVPTPPNRNGATSRNRRIFPMDKSKQITTFPIPPSIENQLKSPAHANILLPSKFAVSK